MTKKEIYFSKDVYTEVAKRLNLTETQVESVLSSYLESFKENIQDTDDIVYKLPFLGNLMITKADAGREIEKLRKRQFRETDPEVKIKIGKSLENYRVRLKKIKIELEKMKHNRTYMVRSKKDRLVATKMALTTPENVKRKSFLFNTTIEEAMHNQNEYAYKHYEKNNLPITL